MLRLVLLLAGLVLLVLLLWQLGPLGVLDALRAEGVPAQPGYAPLNRGHELFPAETFASEWYDTDARLPRVDRDDCPVAQQAFEESIWLPHELFLGSDAVVEQTAEAIAKVQAHAGEL